MSTLWVRFADDSNLPDSMPPDARQKFESLFDAENTQSAWRQALHLTGLSAPHPARMIAWTGHTPYINWTAMVMLIGAGVISISATAEGGYTYQYHYTINRLLAFLQRQWRLARYIALRTDPQWKIPTGTSACIAESLALGLALLSLTLRLPAHTPEELARWLAQPGLLKLRHRQTLGQMQAIQQLRGRLSFAWLEMFPPSPHTDPQPATPDFFWNDPPTVPATASLSAVDKQQSWKGIGVCGPAVTARAMVITASKDTPVLDNYAHTPLALVFPLARPETTELFGKASVVLYGKGGALCHACTIARETNLPCITALGDAFIRDISRFIATGREVWIEADPTLGIVKLIER